MADTDAPHGSPNVLVVALDCVRAMDFPGPHAHPELLKLLQAEFIRFPRATTTSNWTVPSHASIFTGLYPWEHGLFRGGLHSLSPEFPSLATILSGAGYRTASFSSNPFINDELGFTRGFQTAWWGNRIEVLLRLPRSTLIRPHHSGATNPDPSFVAGAAQWLLHFDAAADVLDQLPWIADLLLGTAQRVDRESPTTAARVSPWIEPTIAKWLSSVERSRPLFCFVNLLDAHQPYIGVGPDGDVRSTWADMARIRSLRRTQPPSHPDGPRTPLIGLLGRYRRSIRTLEDRILEIVELFRREDRWRNSIVVITADHGQAFGEAGTIFHQPSLAEEVVRIPLWVRFPDTLSAGGDAQGWASVIDLFPTILERCGIAAPTQSSGVRLESLISGQRRDPVFVLQDSEEVDLSPKRDSLGRLQSRTAGYRVGAIWNHSKLVTDGSDVLTRQLWGENSGPGPSEEGRTQVATQANEILNSVLIMANRAPERDHPVSRRIMAWGY